MGSFGSLLLIIGPKSYSNPSAAFDREGGCILREGKPVMKIVNAASTSCGIMLVLRRALFGFAVLISVIFSHPLQARAQIPPGAASGSGIFYGLRFGLLAHDLGGLWSHTRAEGGVDWNAEVVFKKPSFMLWEGAILPNFGLSINSRGDTSKIYGGVVWEFQFSNGWFFNLGTGLAVHNGQLESEDANKKQLGSRILFREPIEFGFTFNKNHRISVMFDHISNAYLANPNEGMDTLGVRYGYQF
jgi:hypothetical protein